MRARRWALVVSPAITWLAAGPNMAAHAQPPAEVPPAEPPPPNPGKAGAAEDSWRFELYLWGWLSGVDGDIGVRGATISVSETFFDIYDESDSLLALSGRLEFGYGRFGGYLDGLYSDLEFEDQTGPLGLASVDVEFEQSVLDFGFMYRLGDWEPSGGAADNPRNLTLDAYAGGRYTALDVQFRPALVPSFSDREGWVDPVIGVKFVFPFAEHWHGEVNGDIGGFGVESDFTWSATAVIAYDFHIFKAPASLLLGYRAIGWDFSEGSGTSEFTWDVVQHGPLVGLSIRF